jgi:D-sedoheptulose 7-phosphate isomerase
MCVAMESTIPMRVYGTVWLATKMPTDAHNHAGVEAQTDGEATRQFDLPSSLAYAGPADRSTSGIVETCVLIVRKVVRMDLQLKITEALDEHLTVIQQLTAMSPLILQVASELVTTLRRQGKVVLCGNGGSASDAQHMAAEMQGIRAHPETPQGLLALVLTENTALFTAISNDVGYAAAFRRQVEAMVRQDDLVIGLSTSGRSPNVLEALRAAKQLGARAVAFLGESGPLADIADIALCIPSTSVPRIQEAHMFIGHLICELAQRMTTGEYQTRFTAHAG